MEKKFRCMALVSRATVLDVDGYLNFEVFGRSKFESSVNYSSNAELDVSFGQRSSDVATQRVLLLLRRRAVNSE